MNDVTVAAQHELMGDLMDLSGDLRRQRELAQLESEVDGYVDAGVHPRAYVERVRKLTPEQHIQMKKQAKLLHILFPELRQWVESWDLGAGFEETYIAARKILLQRWKKLSVENEDWVQSLLAEDFEGKSIEEKIVRAQARRKLEAAFTPEDWQVIANSAAKTVERNILQIGNVEISETASISVA